MTESISFLLSVIALTISVIALFYAYRRHIEERKPVLVFDEKVNEESKKKREKPVSIDTMIINIGKGAALNIRPANWMPPDDDLWQLPEIARNLAATGETQRYTTFISLPGRRITDDSYWEIHYEDLEGRVYRTVLKGTSHRFDRIR